MASDCAAALRRRRMGWVGIGTESYGKLIALVRVD